MINNKLLDISTPARYIGGEINAIKKIDYKNLFNFCLIFPDIYEIGSSHLGFRLLYDIINRSEKISCERFFAPWKDLLDTQIDNIFTSIENNQQLKDFDALGFSIAYELSYTTIISILKYADIPIKTQDRLDQQVPIIIAGGGATFNPMPISEFIDIFYIGEADDHIVDVLEEIDELKIKRYSKHDILQYLNDKYHFLYIPIIDIDKVVERDVSLSFSDNCGIEHPLIPIIEPIQDRVTIEIARGCTAGCRFCQAGMIYRPVRERSTTAIIKDALTQCNNSGFNEVSLLSLSTGDYSQIIPLIQELNANLSARHISLSTPSLRADSVTEDLFKELTKVRRSSFTIAPEAGSERMRRVINKNLSEEQILESIQLAVRSGITAVKLYFMIGLPFEEDEDIIDIINLAKKIYVAANKKGFGVTISVSPFVPKAHTVFERLGQNSRDELHRKIQLIKKEISSTRFRLKYHDIKRSKIEALLSRGDRSLGKLIATLVEKGSYLDAWDDFFDYDRWIDTADEVGIDLLAITQKSYTDDDILPWENINTGVTKEFKLKEFLNSKLELMIDDCRRDSCNICGVCDFDKIKVISSPKHKTLSLSEEDNSNIIADNSINKDVKKEKEYSNYLIRYAKQGKAKFLSILDLVRLIHHSMKISGVELAFSQGFNPQPRIILIQPLSVGVEGINEIMLIKASTLEIDIFIDTVTPYLVEGLEFLSIEKVPSLKLPEQFRLKLKLGDIAHNMFLSQLSEGIDFYEVIDKKGRKKEIRLDKYLLSHDTDNNTLEMMSDNAGTFNILKFLKLAGLKSSEIELTRLNIKEM